MKHIKLFESFGTTVVYRGSKYEDDKFEYKNMGWEAIKSQEGPGFYFTDTEKLAKAYGKVKAYTLDIQHPLVLDYRKNTHIITKEQAVELYSGSEYKYFYDEWIPFYTGINMENFSEKERVEAYIDKLHKQGDLEILKNLKRAYKAEGYETMMNKMSDVLGYDGVIVSIENNMTVYVAWRPEQIKRLDK